MRVHHKRNGYQTHIWNRDDMYYGSLYYLGKLVYMSSGHNTITGVVSETTKEILNPSMELINQV